MAVASWQVHFGVLVVVGLSLSWLLRGAFGFIAMASVIAAIALGVRYVAIVWEHREPAVGRQAVANCHPAVGVHRGDTVGCMSAAHAASQSAGTANAQLMFT